MPEPDDLRVVREHLDEAHAAADRLVQEAQRQAEAAAGPAAEEVPPRGWESERSTGPGPATPDLQAIVGLLDAVRSSVPPELSRQLAEALRDLLLAVRALLDWYIERLGDPAPGNRAVEVEDIPLD